MRAHQETAQEVMAMYCHNAVGTVSVFIQICQLIALVEAEPSDLYVMGRPSSR